LTQVANQDQAEQQNRALVFADFFAVEEGWASLAEHQTTLPSLGVLAKEWFVHLHLSSKQNDTAKTYENLLDNHKLEIRWRRRRFFEGSRRFVYIIKNMVRGFTSQRRF
jgi:hypothetical protein